MTSPHTQLERTHMDHASPDHSDHEAIRARLVLQLHQVERDFPPFDLPATMERTQTRRRRAKAALDRLDDGSYGLCCQCSEDIEPEVLHFDPSAPFCTDCQAEADLRRRQA